MKTLAENLRTVIPLLVLATAVISCQDTYEEEFQNPERYTEAQVKFLFTQRLDDGWSSQYDMAYFEGWYLIYQDVASWSHITARPNDRNMMRPNISRWESQVWNAFYTNAGPRTQEAWEVWSGQSAEKREETRLYLTLMSILDAHWGSILTDLWGPIPWNEESDPAFRVRQGETIHPKFDDQQVVYTAILDSLAQASETLRMGNFTRPPDLDAQDSMFNGNLALWERFANSLRLRMAMRMQNMNQSRAQEIVTQILEADYPVVESNEENVWWDLRNTTDDVTSGGRRRAFRERSYADRQAVYAPDMVIQEMKEHSDPRLSMLFDPNRQGEYAGMAYAPADQPNNPTRETLSIPDSALYSSEKFPSMIITAPEVSFLKAEAYQRGWVGGNAEAAFERGLRQSVEMWHTAYNMNPDTTIASPDPAAVDAFVSSALESFRENPMKALATQRFIHFNHGQPYQAWSSQRRFDMPALPPATLEGGQTLDRPMRAPYPTTESQNNRNFDKVEDITRFETVAWDAEKH